MFPNIYFILKIKIIFYKEGHGGRGGILACLKEKKNRSFGPMATTALV